MQGDGEVCHEKGTWVVCLGDVWVRVRVCENAGMFIYGVHVKEEEAFVGAGSRLCGPTNACVFQESGIQGGAQGEWTPG